MDWVNSVKEIQQAQENNRLIIFVGAGVSSNSGVPTWGSLIRTIAEKIGYDKCAFCKKSGETCSKENCEKRYAFTQDEFLRIPEYFYQQDTSNEHDAYYRFLQDLLGDGYLTNPINAEIFKILPRHIITTNFDSLLEESQEINARLYAVVSQDKDLLENASERYIIKMHGDIKVPQTIVLKENDYINYEQEHPLISTYIRALLVNHTFAFLGYSLNDYNLNLIIGWINYFSKLHNISERPRHFLLASSVPLECERVRLEAKNIFIVDLSTLPDRLIEQASPSAMLPHIAGRQLYAFLRCVTDSKIFQRYRPLGEILEDKYAVLKAYRRISGKDILRVQPFGRTEHVVGELLFHDREWYDNVSKLIDDNHPTLMDTFRRAGVWAIHFHGKDTAHKEIYHRVEENDANWLLYLDNDYSELLERVETCRDTDMQVYYYHFVGKTFSAIEESIALDERAALQSDYVTILLHKMRARLATWTPRNQQLQKAQELGQLFDTAPIKYHSAIGYLKALFDDSANAQRDMEALLKKHEKDSRERGSPYFDDRYAPLCKLQTYAYDYYYFFKQNYLPLDYFSEPKKYFCYYIQAILCSYAPEITNSQDEVFITKAYFGNYRLNEIDLDILVKYSKSESLKSWIETYNVSYLEMENDVDIVRKYKKLCDSFLHFEVEAWIEHIFCFSIFICLVKMENNAKELILHILASCIIETAKRSLYSIGLLLEPLDYVLDHLTLDKENETKGRLLGILLSKDVFLDLAVKHERHFQKVIKHLALFIEEDVQKQLVKTIAEIEGPEQKCQQIFWFRNVLPMNTYKPFLEQNLSILKDEFLFHLIIEGFLEFTHEIYQAFIETIKKEAQRREDSPELRTYPDWLVSTIDYCLILALFQYNVDLSLLEPYAQYSEHLQFMLDPDGFDYTHIDLGHYMWENLIFSTKYKNYFVAHKEDVLTEDLERRFKMKVETVNQQKIVYGILLDDEMLYRYGK